MAAPIIVTSGSVPSGTSFAAYWRELARRLGPFVSYPTTELSTNFEATVQVLISRLIDDGGDPSRYAGRHLYVVDGDDAGHQTKVMKAGHKGPLGLLEVARTFSAPLAVGTTVDISGSMPVANYEEWPTLQECINKAADGLTFIHDLSMVYVTQQVRYDLSSLVVNWPFREEDVIDVYPPIAIGYTAAQIVARPIGRGYWSVEYDGESPYLQLSNWGANNGETFFVRVKRPSSSWVKRTGVWANSSVGFSAATDEGVYDADTVASAALPIACARLRAYWRAQAKQARRRGDDAAAKAAEIEANDWAEAGQEGGAAAGAARWFRSFRSNGRQRVGAVGGR